MAVEEEEERKSVCDIIFAAIGSPRPARIIPDEIYRRTASVGSQ